MREELRPIDYVKALKNEPDETLRPIKIAVLRSFTCETLATTLPVELRNAGVLAEIFFGGFNQFHQDTYDIQSGLYAFKPDVTVYAVRMEELFPAEFRDYLESGVGAEDIFKISSEVMTGYEKMLAFAKEKLGCEIIVHNFLKPFETSDGLFHQQSFGIGALTDGLNARLREYCAGLGVYVADAADIAAALGREAAFDPRAMEFSGNPYSFKFYARLSRLYSRFIRSIFFPRAKCLVLDLDDTLWDGILGETPFTECKPFNDFQRRLKLLAKTGILLAASSKNNDRDVRAFFDAHKEMPLGINDFSIMKINWNDKPGNIIEIARELNIGLDSLVFIDDNPAERELVRIALPDVTVADLPGGRKLCEKDFIDALDGLYCLDYLRLTDEDKNRGAMYEAERDRESFKRAAGNLEDYLLGLEMEAEIFSVGGRDMPRAAQLTQKTNQFNLTVKRYTEGELFALTQRGFYIFGLRLKDKFGDNGMTGLMIIEPAGDEWIIDSFLLSCRIMSRRAEYLFMAEVIRAARTAGIKSVAGRYIQAERNAPVAELYKEMGFNKRGDFWQWDCAKEFAAPGFIKLERGIDIAQR